MLGTEGGGVIFDYIVRERANSIAVWIGAAILSVPLSAQASAQTIPYRFVAEGAGQPPVEGRLWLYASGWGWIDRIELGQIQGGDLDLVTPQTFPEHWPFSAGDAYLIALETVEGLWHPSKSTVSRQEPPDAAGSRETLADVLLQILDELSSSQTFADGKRTIVLRPQIERRITLLHEDGTPLTGEAIDMDVFIGRRNHCGVAVGLGAPQHEGGVLGTYRTDSEGSFTLVAPDATLLLRRRHYPIVDSLQGGVLRMSADAIEVEPGRDATIRSMWEALRSPDAVSVRILTPAGAPIAGWFVTWDMNTNTCGPPVSFHGPSDADGWIRFQTPAGFSASLTRAMSVRGSDVPRGDPWDRPLIHELTREELVRFARDGTVTLLLAAPQQ